MNFGECDELRSSFSPAVSRNITGCCISNIGETPKKQSFLRREGLEKDFIRFFGCKS